MSPVITPLGKTPPPDCPNHARTLPTRSESKMAAAQYATSGLSVSEVDSERRREAFLYSFRLSRRLASERLNFFEVFIYLLGDE